MRRPFVSITTRAPDGSWLHGLYTATRATFSHAATFEVSSRPSDAIALAVRMAVPIFASEEVLEEASILIPGEEDEEVEKFREFLDNISPEDFAT